MVPDRATLAPLQISANNGQWSYQHEIGHTYEKTNEEDPPVIVRRRQGPIFTKKLAKSAKKIKFGLIRGAPGRRNFFWVISRLLMNT